MSIFKKQALVATFPAYDVFEREAAPKYQTGVEGAVEISSTDILGLDSGRGFHRTYSPGSVASYALEYNECPIEAYERAVARGHKTHWINHRATALTAHKQAKETLVQVRVGMLVRFEGRLFTIEAAPNDNLSLKPFVAVQAAA